MTHQGKPYTEDERKTVIETICDGLMDGKSLRQICRDPDMPNKVTILRWLNDETDTLAPIIARARSFQAEALDDDIQDITNRMLEGEIGHQEARVAIWAAQWRASKMKPKKYGDKVQTEHSGSLQVSELSESQVMERLTQLLAKAKPEGSNETAG